MNVRRSISGLPIIPMVSVRPATFDLCNLLALMLTEMKRKKVVVKAQRSYADDFNRVRSAAISRKRRQLERAGWVKRVEKTHGLIPDSYEKGISLKNNPSLDRKWNDIAKALYGKKGLLTDFLGSPAWGHHCLNPGAIATLSVLIKAEESVTVPKLIQYLSPICSETTVRNGAKKLIKLGIVRDVSGIFVLSEDWSVLLRGYFVENPCCLDRSIKGKSVRASEREAVRSQVTSGALSPAEKGQLRSLPCVRCGSKATQQEHFPPKRFLKDLSKHNGRDVVWAICWSCNQGSRKFIQEMPMLRPQRVQVNFRKGVNPWMVYRAQVNMLLIDWYNAVERNDVDSAITAVQKALDLYAALIDIYPQKTNGRINQTPVKKPRQQMGRKHRGKRMTSSSQLPHR